MNNVLAKKKKTLEPLFSLPIYIDLFFKVHHFLINSAPNFFFFTQ